MPIDAPIHTNEANLPRVLRTGLPVLLVFWRRDCAPCDALMPGLDRLAREYAGRALIVKVNAAEEEGLLGRYQISRLPSIVFIKDGVPLATGVGAATERELAAWLEHLTGSGARPPVPAGASVPVTGREDRAPEQRAERAPGRRPEGAVRRSPPEAGTGQPVVLTDATFDRVIRESKVPVLVDFWAPWCGPCKAVAPVVADLAREFAGRAVVAKLDVDDYPHIAGRYGVMSIPTLLIFKDGLVVDQLVGAQPAQVLRQRLARHVK